MFTIVYLLIVILWYFVLCHFASKCLVCHCFDVLSFHSAELWYPFLPCIHALHCNVRICVYTCIKFPANASKCWARFRCSAGSSPWQLTNVQQNDNNCQEWSLSLTHTDTIVRYFYIGPQEDASNTPNTPAWPSSFWDTSISTLQLISLGLALSILDIIVVICGACITLNLRILSHYALRSFKVHLLLWFSDSWVWNDLASDLVWLLQYTVSNVVNHFHAQFRESLCSHVHSCYDHNGEVSGDWRNWHDRQLWWSPHELWISEHDLFEAPLRRSVELWTNGKAKPWCTSQVETRLANKSSNWQ